VELQIGQNELKTIQSGKEMLRNDAKNLYLVYERWKQAKSELYQGKRKLRRRLTCMASLGTLV